MIDERILFVQLLLRHFLPAFIIFEVPTETNLNSIKVSGVSGYVSSLPGWISRVLDIMFP